MATWPQLSDEVIRSIYMGLAEGALIDEGEKRTDWEGLHPVMNRVAEDRPASIEIDPDAAPWLFANPPENIPEPYRSALIALAENSHPQVRRALVEAMARPANVYGIVETRIGIPRYRRGSKDSLTTREFMARFHGDVSSMMQLEGLTRRAAEIEFAWRYAEEQTGVRRARNSWEELNEGAQGELRAAKEAAYQRVYRNT